MLSIQKKALKLQEKELICQIIALNENVTLNFSFKDLCD